MQYDVVIVGGGPAGAAAAISLAKNGKTVCILEREQKNRSKTCGDGLMPDAKKALELLGVWDEIIIKAKQSHRAEFFFPKGKPIKTNLEFTIIKRQILDNILLEQAEKSGATVNYSTQVQEIIDKDTFVEILTTTERINGLKVILATGANVGLAQKAGITIDPKATGAAIRGYAKLKAPLDTILVFFEKDLLPGYGWIFPINEYEANVGIGYSFSSTPEQKDLNKLLAIFIETPRVRQYIDGQLTSVSAWPLRAGLSTIAGTKNILLCGENMNTTCNLIGEGVGKALWSGIIAAECISKQASLPDEYALQIQQTMGATHEGYNKLQKATASKKLRTLLMNRTFVMTGSYLLNTKKGKKIIADIYNENKTAEEISSIKNVVKNVLF